VIVDERGRVVGSGLAGPADHVDEPPGSTKFADACEAAVSRAFERAALAAETPVVAVHIGLSGYDAEFDGVLPTFGAASVRVEHDAPIALAAAVQTRPAIVVIAGTGSVAYGEDGEGRRVRVGGWGYLFGDEGSAYAIARDALAHAMRAEDRGAPSALGDAALAFFDRRSLREIATLVLLGRIPRSELAAFARLVHDGARLGDDDAAQIVAAASDALAELARSTVARLELRERATPVALVGGAFANEPFFARTAERIAQLAPGAHAVRGRYEPAVGAALLAFADAGLDVPETILS
jgi:N-acetylglucosamine kinase-like BadF-type ATPase